MKNIWKALMVVPLAIILLVPGGLLRADGHGQEFRGDDDDGGSVFISPGYYGGGWYSPWWNGWGWGWGWGWGRPAYFPPSRDGRVKIKTWRKNASVYVDGGYVGRAAKAKDLRLRPGNHLIQMRNAQGRLFYQQRVHVMRGKTIKLDANTANYPPPAAAHPSTGPPAHGSSPSSS